MSSPHPSCSKPQEILLLDHACPGTSLSSGSQHPWLGNWTRKKAHSVFLPSASCHTSWNLAGLQFSIFVTPGLSNLFLLTPGLAFVHQVDYLRGEAGKPGVGESGSGSGEGGQRHKACSLA